MKAKLVAIAGIGVKGLEHCPPYYHIDFARDEWELFIRDPGGVLRQIGYKGDIPEKLQIQLVNPGQAWDSDAKRWVDLTPEVARVATVCNELRPDGVSKAHNHCPK